MNKKEIEIDADRATLIARNYFEKSKDTEPKSTMGTLVDWMNFTIDSVKRGRKFFEVKCELYDEPSSSTRTKYKVKISKNGEIKKVGKETK